MQATITRNHIDLKDLDKWQPMQDPKLLKASVISPSLPLPARLEHALISALSLLKCNFEVTARTPTPPLDLVSEIPIIHHSQSKRTFKKLQDLELYRCQARWNNRWEYVGKVVKNRLVELLKLLTHPLKILPPKIWVKPFSSLHFETLPPKKCSNYCMWDTKRFKFVQLEISEQFLSLFTNRSLNCIFQTICRNFSARCFSIVSSCLVFSMIYH